MFQLVYVVTGQVVRDNISSEEECWEIGLRWLYAELRSSNHGKRMIKMMGGEIPESFLLQQFELRTYIGCWTDTYREFVPPEEVGRDDEEWLIFETNTGKRYLGIYDFAEGLFICQRPRKECAVEEIKRYFIIPPVSDDEGEDDDE